MVSATFLGKHWHVKPTCGCHTVTLIPAGVSWAPPRVTAQVFHLPRHLQKEPLSGCSAVSQLISQAVTVCNPGMLKSCSTHCPLMWHGKGRMLPSSNGKPCREMPSPGRVSTDSTTAFVLTPFHFSLPVAIIAHQHRLTIAQASPQNKWNQGWGPISVGGALPLTLNGIGI